jgi:hypothetical protein
MTAEKTVTVTPEMTLGHFVAHMPLIQTPRIQWCPYPAAP